MKVAISQEGLSLSRIIAGVWKWGVWGARLSIKEEAELIEHCVNIGVTSFDHADIYGDYMEEERFGRAFNDTSVNRKDIQLVTKCGIRMVCDSKPQHKINSYDTSKDHIRNSVEQSLRNLRTDYIDLLLIHRPSPLMDPEQIAEIFTALKESGKVLHFGVSNFTSHQFDLLHSYYPLVTNQVEASVLMQEPFSDGTFDQALKYKFRPMVWSPLGSGKLFGTSQDTRIRAVQSISAVLSKKHNCQPSQIYLAFLLHHPAGLIPIMGTSKKDRIQSAVDSLKIQLSDEEWFEIWRASLGKDVP